MSKAPTDLMKLAWFQSVQFGQDPRTLVAIVDVADDLTSYTLIYRDARGQKEAFTYEGDGVPKPDGSRAYMEVVQGQPRYTKNGAPIYYPPPDDRWWNWVRLPDEFKQS